MNISIPCRSCASVGLELVLDLGCTPLANSLLTVEQLVQPEATYPLKLAFCPHCTLVQITETVPPEQLFREYLYFSSFSDAMVQHAQVLANELITSRKLTSESLVVEIASNDGYLLQHYKHSSIPVLGVEPAINVARVAEEKHGIRNLCEFFDQATARRMVAAGWQADVVHAHNVLAHVSDLNSFVKGIALLLKETGVAVIEVPYVKDLIDQVEFDTIYHEHLCYFSLTALSHLFERNNLTVLDVQHLSLHGGSLRLFVGSNGTPSIEVEHLLHEEAAWGVNQLSFYQSFSGRVERLRIDLLSILNDLRNQGKRIAGYGASAKGSTLLNYFGIQADVLDFIVDRSTVKQGYYTPGTHLPIFAPEKLLEALPDYVLLLTWNFKDEILQQQQAFKDQGGHFIVPIPQPCIT